MEPLVHLAQANLPDKFIQDLLSNMAAAYKQADSIAKTHFEANLAFHRGYARWGLCDDALYSAASLNNLSVTRVQSANSQVHTEVTLKQVVLIMKKVNEPGQTGSARYRLPLLANQRGLFDEIPSPSTTRPLLVEITHGPDKEDPTRMGFAHLMFPNTDGSAYIHFPIVDALVSKTVEDEGVELVTPFPALKLKNQ